MLFSLWSAIRIEIGTTLISSQNKDSHIYAEERSKLLKDQERRMAELKRQQNAEKVQLEEEFSAEFVRLMEKHKHLTEEELQHVVKREENDRASINVFKATIEPIT